MRSRASLVLAGLLALSASGLQAQEDEWLYEPDAPRGQAGIALTYARPQGEFRDFVDDGWGASLHYVHNLDRQGVFGIRVDGGFLIYGYERMRVPLSPTIGGRILVDLTTTNSIAHLGVGPQISAPAGPIRPYVNGFAGLSYISTSSSVEGSANYDDPFATTTNFDDATFSYGAGGGVLIPFGRGRNPVSLDAGVTYRVNGVAEYLTEGGIEDNPDGSITLYPIRSDTDLLTFHLGVSVGVGR